ncbi:hypothetical protein E3J85_02470, partial [Patescibacteria group bacterium]
MNAEISKIEQIENPVDPEEILKDFVNEGDFEKGFDFDAFIEELKEWEEDRVENLEYTFCLLRLYQEQKGLEDENQYVCWEASENLGALAKLDLDKYLELYQKGLESVDSETRLKTAKTLGSLVELSRVKPNLGETIIKLYQKGLGSDNEDVRRGTARALGPLVELGKENPELKSTVMELCEKGLLNSDHYEQWGIIESLSSTEIIKDNPELKETVIKLYQKGFEDRSTIQETAESLGALAELDLNKYLELYQKGLESREQFVAITTARTLGSLAKLDLDKYLELYREGLRNRHAGAVSGTAPTLAALAKLDLNKYLELYQAGLKSGNSAIRLGTIYSLKSLIELSKRDPELQGIALELYLKGLGDEYFRVRWENIAIFSNLTELLEPTNLSIAEQSLALKYFVLDGKIPSGSIAVSGDLERNSSVEVPFYQEMALALIDRLERMASSENRTKTNKQTLGLLEALARYEMLEGERDFQVKTNNYLIERVKELEFVLDNFNKLEKTCSLRIERGDQLLLSELSFTNFAGLMGKPKTHSLLSGNYKEELDYLAKRGILTLEKLSYLLPEGVGLIKDYMEDQKAPAFFKRLLHNYPYQFNTVLETLDQVDNFSLKEESESVFELLDEIGTVTPIIFERYRETKSHEEKKELIEKINNLRADFFTNQPVENILPAEDRGILAEMIYISYRPIGMSFREVKDYLEKLEDRSDDLDGYSFPSEGYPFNLDEGRTYKLREDEKINPDLISRTKTLFQVSPELIEKGENEIGKILGKLVKGASDLEDQEVNLLLSLISEMEQIKEFKERYESLDLNQPEQLFHYLNELRENLGVLFSDHCSSRLTQFLKEDEKTRSRLFELLSSEKRLKHFEGS